MTETATITELTCTRCGHKWYPRSPALPTRCPKCISPYWNKPRKIKTSKPDDVNNVKAKKYRLLCLKCGYDWTSNNNHPTRCANPKCRSPYWDKGREE